MKVGETYKDIALQNHDGKTVKLSDYIGTRHVVLYFYPKDDTPGCTKEACSFRDSYEAFVEAGAEVIGVSADSVSSHKKFRQNRNLPFQLLSDPDNETRKLYGVSGSLFGLLPGRETFVIDKSGVIRHRFSSQLNIGKHITDALEILRGL